MEILKSSKYLWIKSGLYTDDNIPTAYRLIGYLFEMIIAILVFLVLVLSLACVMLCDKPQSKIFQALFQAIAAVACFYTVIALKLQKNRLTKTVMNIESDVNKRINSNNIAFYKNAEKYSTLFTKLPLIFGFAFFDGIFLMYTIITWSYESYNNQVDVTKWLTTFVFW